MRGEGSGQTGNGVIFRNIRVEDKRPTLQSFFIAMKGAAPYDASGQARGAGDMTGVLFQNIAIAAPSVLGEPEILWGAAGSAFTNITFDNVTIGGVKLVSQGQFNTNGYVNNLIFK
ncbi:hypothetical protein RCH09_001472 [Actimicrobium sp. GrIS 1.19]|uniref:hypothetical protein n=1 Tax=Actimicrobium sp. GrIS 1.19 TaxID=3071708 RepID=UPI002DFB2B58|nr:hypothetical protein [Actimicrobium sp. GrIS 1.19]